MNPALLSMIIRDQRKLTPDSVRKMGIGLGLSENEVELYVQDLSNGQENIAKKNKIKQMNQISLDTFYIVTEWYHDAIMELSKVTGFDGKALFISRSLGISVAEAQTAIERLQRVGLIEIQKDGSWVEVKDHSTIQHDDFTDVALRRFQEKVLELSSASIKSTPKEHRDHSCITMSIRRSDLKEAKKRIREFRRDMMGYLQRKDKKSFDDVYCLSVSLFPLTNFYKKD